MTVNRVLITGGAGFIGSNLANRLLGQGKEVAIFDNLSRVGCIPNLEWLRELHGESSFELIEADINDYVELEEAVKGASLVYHLAGQVAVTSSVSDPRKDFYENALGTLNVLEAARVQPNSPIVVYASTNKVYGELNGLPIDELETRYRFPGSVQGISESFPLDFHSPYGCSKGAADQYVRDYARIYGLRTVVLRQSCIYGYRQFGVEDQGWVAWFTIAALTGRPITIYGNGKQVRDILFIEDLLNVYDLVVDNIAATAGEIYNIGGGSANAISIWKEFGPLLERLLGRETPVSYGEQRPGDQIIYISDIAKAKQDFNWQPQVSIKQGISELFHWTKENIHFFV